MQKSNINHPEFQNRVVAVTGSARGIGKNILGMFGRKGATVIICDYDEKQGMATVDEFNQEGIDAGYLNVDLCKTDAAKNMINEIMDRWSRLDVLVNNARTRDKSSMTEEDEDRWDSSMDVSLKSAFFAGKETVRVMSQNGGGAIINISSVASFKVCNESPSYHIAKAGLEQMTRYLAVHAGIYGVRVNAVIPGFIVQDEHRTRFMGSGNQNYREIAEFCHPLKRVGCSDDVADAVLFLSSKQSSFITGQCLVVDGGLTIQDPSDLVFKFERKKSSKD